MEGVSPSGLLMGFFHPLLKDVLLVPKGSQTQVSFRGLDGKDGHVQERQKDTL